jgi:hypothetical protein
MNLSSARRWACHSFCLVKVRWNACLSHSGLMGPMQERRNRPRTLRSLPRCGIFRSGHQWNRCSRWEGASGFRGRPRDGRRVGSGLHEGIPCRRLPLLRPRAGRRRASWRRDVSARSRSPEPDLAVATDRRSRFSVRRGSLGPSSVAHALRPTLTLVVEAPGAASCSKHARDRTRLKPDQIQGSPSFGRRNHIMHECDIHFCARGVGRSGHRRVDVGRHDLEDASTPSEGGCARETRARPVRPGQMRKRFCERRHQTDVNRQAVGVFPCRTLYLASEPVAREILFRMTARPKRCIHWR